MQYMIRLRNKIIGFLYRNILKPVFFLFDPEDVHDLMTFTGRVLGGNPITRWCTSVMFNSSHPNLKQTIAGIEFKNPLGLAAGFDKNAQLTGILPEVGFGFEEVGSITGEVCPGNPRPRLWRLKSSGSLLVYYGLKNDGAETISKRLEGKKFNFPVGISIAKTNNQACADEQQGITDYVKAFKIFNEKNIGDYFTINISCPNTFGGEPFTTPEKFERLIAALKQVPSQRPMFIKMPSEMPFETLDKMIEVARKYKITGFISTNLAKDRKNENIKDQNFPNVGGMSGRVVQELSDRQVEYLYKKTKGEFVIIGCGGVFSAEDAYRKIKLGASLIQLITGMIFQGPQVLSEINQGLVELLKKDGYNSISEAVGKNNQ